MFYDNFMSVPCFFIGDSVHIVIAQKTKKESKHENEWNNETIKNDQDSVEKLVEKFPVGVEKKKIPLN